MDTIDVEMPFRSHGAARAGDARAPECPGTLRAVLRARLVLGLYCRLPTRARLPARLYCLALASTTTILFLTFMKKYHISILATLPVIFEYNINVLFSIISEEIHLISFCNEIDKTDLDMGLHNAPLVARPTKFPFILICAARVSLFAICLYLSPYDTLSWITFSFIVTSYAIQFSQFTMIIPLDVVRHRLRLVRVGLEADLAGHDWNRNNNSHQIQAIQACLQTYKKLIDNLEKALTWKKLLIFLSMAMAFWKILYFGNDFIWSIKNGVIQQLLKKAPYLAEHSLTCVVVCLPPVFGELIINEADKLKLFIGNHQLLCDDVEAGEALAQAARFLRVRAPRVTLGGVCALDAGLLLAFVSLFTTYFIVMVQFAGIM